MLSVSNPVFGLLILSAAGMFLAYAYTAPPFYWKYKGLGDICMVLGFGPLLVAGAYYCQLSALPSLASLWFSLAPGLLTDGILHANNTRDQAWDKQCGAVTLPMKLGKTFSGYYFVALYVFSYATMFAVALSSASFLHHGGSHTDSLTSLMFLSPLVLLPNCMSLISSYYAADFKELCPRCGLFAGMFGALESVAIVMWKWNAKTGGQF
jgi:1,4-dihydroxy-2-naphthoate octaprenyltransferase